VLVILPADSASTYWWLPDALVVFLLAALARYLSTSYRIDDRDLRAWRILGGRRVRLEEVRAIEFASLRDLSPVGFFGAWGWRGRMWSPIIGRFDSVHTDPALGLLITAGDASLFISPQDPAGFARELSRRVRSYTGRLSVDVGDPLGTNPSSSMDAAR
jgi:Bacterial PH domain